MLSLSTCCARVSQLKIAGREIQSLNKAKEALEREAQQRVDEAVAAREEAVREGRQAMAVVAVQQRGLQMQARIRPETPYT